MLTLFTSFAFAMVLAFAATPLVRRLAVHLGALDREQATKIHANDIPRLGGVAIAVAFYAPILVLAFRSNLVEQQVYEQPRRVLALLIGGLAILLLGIFDDMKGATAGKKLLVQVPVAALTWWAGVRIGHTAGLIGNEVSFPPPVSLAVTVGWLVLVMNAVNLIDGLDGLASGIALMALLTIGLCAFHRDDVVLALLVVCLAGGVLGFLLHNFHPASIFMGDSGSLFLGYVIGTASIWSSHKAATAIGVVLPMVILGLPILDATLAIFRRLVTGRPLFTGDLDHIHHRLLAIGWSQRSSVLVLYLISGVFSGLALLLSYSDDHRLAWPILAVAVVAALGFARWLGYLSPSRLQAATQERRRNLRVRQALQKLETRVMASPDRVEVRSAIQEFEDRVLDSAAEDSAPPAIAKLRR